MSASPFSSPKRSVIDASPSCDSAADVTSPAVDGTPEVGGIGGFEGDIISLSSSNRGSYDPSFASPFPPSLVASTPFRRVGRSDEGSRAQREYEMASEAGGGRPAPEGVGWRAIDESWTFWDGKVRIRLPELRSHS